VRPNSFLEVIGHSGVQRTVAASEHVDVPAHGARSLRAARDTEAPST
jgi:hypothetical protein